MSARDDYPALVNEATLGQGSTDLSHECAQALEEIKRLRHALRHPTPTSAPCVAPAATQTPMRGR